MENPYILTKINNINLHYGNGAKNELKKENKKYNFKFYYKVNNKYKNCSAGFDDIKSFTDFIQPIYKKYYMFEYIFENKQCIPYFDYEYELDEKPTNIKLNENIIKIKELLKIIFTEIFKIELKEQNIIIMQSHGFKENKKFKVSFHIIIIGYYFENNYECSYLCDKIKEKDNNFDSSVYSKDRMMRCVLSSKDWNDSRVLLPLDRPIKLENLEDYLITNVKPDYIKLKCPNKIKKFVNLKNYNRKYISKQYEENEIGQLIENIIKKTFHEDAFFVKSSVKYDGITFYGFNYNNRNEKCFTGNLHDKLGFYCYLDKHNNILLKCFSDNCKNYKKVIGNLNDSIQFDNAININNKYLNENTQVKELIKTFKKCLLIKSDMGTGKTEIVCNYIDKCKPERILWLSTRQTYAENINERLKKYNFTNYLNDKEGFYKKDRIIVQLESLYHLEKNYSIKYYDLIVLDEIESLLYHFDSPTIAERSKNIFDLLYMLCLNTKTKIIAMDADLNLRGIEYIKDIDKDYKLVVNQYRNKLINLNMTNNKNFFIDEIKESIKNKKKICIIGLSTKLLYQLEEIIKELEVKYILHTRDSDDKFKHELALVNDLWSKYQVVIYSPTISVGVDFTKSYFDEVFSIIIPNTASPRIYKQMLGRIRNMKTDKILTYYQNVNSNMDSILYNYNDIIEYFKYCDSDIKSTKKYKLEEEGINVVNGFTLYDKIMMHNKIEDLNKSTNNFMTQLNVLFNESNYSITFINNITEKKKKFELNDDIYKEKIFNTKDIDNDEYLEIGTKINNNMATEDDKFEFQKYKFKKFWNLENVTMENINMYFRCEHSYNRLLKIFDKKVIDKDYIDYNVENKIIVIKNIIKTLGFNLNDLTIKLTKEQYYDNIKVLLSDKNDFKKNYDNIRILFEKDKHILKDSLKGSALAKLINGFLEDFGLVIEYSKKNTRSGKKFIPEYYYKIKVHSKYKNII